MHVNALRDEHINEQFAEPQLFKAIFRQCQKEKIALVVSTFGTENVVKAYLNRLLGTYNKIPIMTPLKGNLRYAQQSAPEFAPKHKNAHLKHIQRVCSIHDPSRIVFFDDSQANIVPAKTSGYTCVWVNNRRCLKGLTQDVLSPLASLTHSIQSFEHELETKFPKFSAAKSVNDTLRFMSSLTDQNIVVLHSTNELSLGKKGGLKLNCFFKFKPEERIIEEQLEYLPSIGFIHHSVDEGEKIYKTPQLFFRTYCEAINWLKII